MKLIPTILCGGAGSRLLPVSRELHPKPFIQLAEGQSLLQKAWLRGAVLPDVAEVLTVNPTAIHEVLIIEPKVFGDERGFFFLKALTAADSLNSPGVTWI